MLSFRYQIELGKGWIYLEKKVFGSDGLLGLDYGNMSYSDAVKKITVQHLLEQTDGWGSSLPEDCSNVEKNIDQKDYIDCMLDDATNDPNFSPGTKWRISSFGYVLLGRIIEKLAKITDQKMTYKRYVRKKVLKACGATNLYIGRAKVILHKLRSGISLVEQDTFGYVS